MDQMFRRHRRVNTQGTESLAMASGQPASTWVSLLHGEFFAPRPAAGAPSAAMAAVGDSELLRNLGEGEEAQPATSRTLSERTVNLQTRRPRARRLKSGRWAAPVFPCRDSAGVSIWPCALTSQQRSAPDASRPDGQPSAMFIIVPH